MLRIISERIKAGVEVKIIGKVEAKWNIQRREVSGQALHVRAMIRDGKRAFVGSQSLRRLELEKRREVGVIVTDEVVVGQLKQFFEVDWAKTETGQKRSEEGREG